MALPKGSQGFCDLPEAILHAQQAITLHVIEVQMTIENAARFQSPLNYLDSVVLSKNSLCRPRSGAAQKKTARIDLEGVSAFILVGGAGHPECPDSSCTTIDHVVKYDTTKVLRVIQDGC
jgi:hypothetical protein